jgi:flagellar assembly protein FliH
MAFAKLIAFDRPLTGAVLPGQGRVFTESEVAAKTEEAYRRGVDSARAVVDQKLVEFRAEMADLSDGVLQRLNGLEDSLVAQLRDALPGLAVDLANRLLAGYEPPPEIVERLCRDALEQLFPEREGLEVSLCPRDLDLLNELSPDWLKRYPGIRLVADPSLVPGDCVVRSRFGVTDARQSTKRAALAHSLTGA